MLTLETTKAPDATALLWYDPSNDARRVAASNCSDTFKRVPHTSSEALHIFPLAWARRKSQEAVAICFNLSSICTCRPKATRATRRSGRWHRRPPRCSDHSRSTRRRRRPLWGMSPRSESALCSEAPRKRMQPSRVEFAARLALLEAERLSRCLSSRCCSRASLWCRWMQKSHCLVCSSSWRPGGPDSGGEDSRCCSCASTEGCRAAAGLSRGRASSRESPDAAAEFWKFWVSAGEERSGTQRKLVSKRQSARAVLSERNKASPRFRAFAKRGGWVRPLINVRVCMLQSSLPAA